MNQNFLKDIFLMSEITEKFSDDKRTLRKREKRAEKAKEEGRLPGINGRPPIFDKEADDIVSKKIFEDANEGIYHDISWVKEMVCLIFIYEYLLLGASNKRCKRRE
jgi:hypothetical protein